MFNQNQLNQYLEIRINKGQSVADSYGAEIIKELELETAAQRGEAWDALRKTFNKKRKEIRKEEEKKERLAKREAQKNKASIKKTCEEILKTAFSLSDYEAKFLDNIKSKRKLTVKQESFLRKVAKSSGVNIAGVFLLKQTKNISTCQHEDLGSLGYTHGTTVKCPHCGSLAEVW